MWTPGEEGPCVHRRSWPWLSDGQGELSGARLHTRGWGSRDKGEGTLSRVPGILPEAQDWRRVNAGAGEGVTGARGGDQRPRCGGQ